MNEIGKSILKGAFFTGISKYSIQFINLVVVSVLAHILPPSDFGIIAITTVVVSFFDILANAGMGPAIIQNKSLNNNDIVNIFRFSIILAIVLSIIFLSIINPISHFYEDSKLRIILSFLTIQLFFNTLNVVPLSLLLKKKKFNFLAKISTLTSVVLGLVSVLCAYLKCGIYSLLIIPIGTSIISFFIYYWVTLKHTVNLRNKFNINPIKSIFSFSAYQFCFNLVNFFSRNLDKLLLGKYVGMSSLGYYEKSYRLMTLPISTLTNVFNPVLQPVLSDYQNDLSIIKSVYNKFCKYLFFIGCLLCPFLFFSAKEVIWIVFGNQWSDAVPIFKLLSLSIPFQLVDSLSGSIFQSSNDVKSLFISGLICSILNISLLCFALIFFDNINLIAFTVSLSFIANFFVSTYFINKFSIAQSYIQYLKITLKYLYILFSLSIVLFVLDTIMLNMWILFLLKILITLIMGTLSAYIFKIIPSNLTSR